MKNFKINYIGTAILYHWFYSKNPIKWIFAHFVHDWQLIQYGIETRYQRLNGKARFDNEISACQVSGHQCILCR